MDPILSDLEAFIRQYPWALVAVTGLGPLFVGWLITRGSRGEASEADSTLPQAAAAAAEVGAPALSEDEPEEASRDEAIEAPAIAPEIPAPPKIGLRDRLLQTSEALVGRLSVALGGRKVDADLMEELEEILFTADLGVSTAESLLDRVRSEGQGADGEAVRGLLKRAMSEKLAAAERTDEALSLMGAPHVILVLGVNGAGKTTTIGKLAAQHQARGRSVLLGAGDTFRAAAIEQLQAWGDRVGCDVIAGEAGGDVPERCGSFPTGGQVAVQQARRAS